jgi:hypothetical protein
MRRRVAEVLKPSAQFIFVIAESWIEELRQVATEQLWWAGEGPLKDPHELVERAHAVVVGERLHHECHPVLTVAELVEH